MSASDDPRVSRRTVLRAGLRGGAAAALAALAGLVFGRRAVAREPGVWQIDPDRCNQCGNCATRCVLRPSAVKCVQDYAVCGYCDLCFAYFNPRTSTREPPGVNGQCPTDAIRRKRLEDPYYEYRIDEALCIGCGICIRGCEDAGNGSLHLQIKQDLCVQCNQCAIAVACPADAIHKVPASTPYLHRSSKPGSVG